MALAVDVLFLTCLPDSVVMFPVIIKSPPLLVEVPENWDGSIVLYGTPRTLAWSPAGGGYLLITC